MIRLRILFILSVVFAFCLSMPAYCEVPINENAKDLITGLSKMFETNFDSSQTLGKPVEAGDYVIIPVVVKGIGFGFGTKLEGGEREAGNSDTGKKENNHKDRLGLGGGGFVKPVALIFVKKDGDFKLIKLNQGFLYQFAKNLAPAMAGVVKETIKTLIKMHQKKKQKARDKKLKKQHQREREVIIRKKMEMGPREERPPFVRPGSEMSPGPGR
ncbi:MAG: hypothetical protein Kow0029_19030 [Candidatus Rifleibacteriota bacterium]